MTWLNHEAIVVSQLTIIGAVAWGAIYYRLYMWRHRRVVVVRAMTVSAIVFGCFGVGVTISFLFHHDFLARMQLSFNILLLGPSVLFLVYRFWQGRPLLPVLYKSILIFSAWYFFSRLGLRYSWYFLQLLSVGVEIVCVCLIAGCINGLLGPLVPAFVIVHTLSSIVSNGAVGWGGLPYSASLELLLDFLPDWLSSLRTLVGLVLMVLGMAEFIAFFGVKVSVALDRVHDWAA